MTWHRLIAFAWLAVSAAAVADLPGTPGNEFAALYGDGFPIPADPPERTRGKGPYDRLVIRGATLIDGTGAPPIGPMDIVIENNRIVRVVSVGYPGLPIAQASRPAPGTREIDAEGHYVLPGFIDSHAHISSVAQAEVGVPSPAEYVYKLWLAHGITTVREIGSINGLDWTLGQRELSAENGISAPRIFAYALFPIKQNFDMTPAEAVEWVRAVKQRGADGIKFMGTSPDVMQAALEEADALGLMTGMHHAQMAVAQVDVLDSSAWGLDAMEHWYGLPEALFEDKTLQDYPHDYNYNNEQHRFGQAGRLWLQAAKPGSAQWNHVMETLLARDFTLVPTMTIYEASRDLMRARNADWHGQYTWPTLWRFYQANRAAHGAYWFYWTTADEIAWKRNYHRWMRFLNEYKNRGGRVAAGSDAGFIYKVYGFAFVRELELLQEAGFHPLEVVRAASLKGAELLRSENDLGTVEEGKLADLVILEENPLENFKVLYGTGALKLDDDTGQTVRVGGVRWTIKDGIVFDAKSLLADVRGLVSNEKLREAGE